MKRAASFNKPSSPLRLAIEKYSLLVGTGGWAPQPGGLLFSCLVMFNSLCPHGLQHTSLPCPSLSPGVCSNSCPVSQGCHPTISSPIISFSSCLQSFLASESFPASWLFFTSGGQSIGASASASVLPINIQG